MPSQLSGAAAGNHDELGEAEKPHSSPVRTRGLHRTPLSGGVNATRRYDLPPPPLAARNLVGIEALLVEISLPCWSASPRSARALLKAFTGQPLTSPEDKQTLSTASSSASSFCRQSATKLYTNDSGASCTCLEAKEGRVDCLQV